MQSAESTASVRRGIILGVIVLPLFVGCGVFLNLVGDPHFHSIRNLDVVRLIAVGACWGVAAVGVGLVVDSRRSASARR